MKVKHAAYTAAATALLVIMLLLVSGKRVLIYEVRVNPGDHYVVPEYGNLGAPRRFVWNPTFTMKPVGRARWACGQVACRPVHMSTGRIVLQE
jgi:hypothetical protein